MTKATGSDKSVLFIDDDPAMCESTAQLFQIAHYDVTVASRAREALAGLTPDFPGVIVTDIKMPEVSGLDLLQEVRKLDPELPVILVTGHGDVPLAVQAMKEGAYDFVEKPFDPDRLLAVVGHALEKRRLVLDVRRLQEEQDRGTDIGNILLGTSGAMERLRQDVLDVADTDASVLILGETGTGKELVARCLHDLSPRKAGVFAPINCGAVPAELFEAEFFGHEAGTFTGAKGKRVGLFEYANGGTVFLDEVTSLDVTMQAKLLRVLQDRQVKRLGSNELIATDFRTVSACNEDIEALVAEGRFRQDLYFRLDTVQIRIPPLRERGADILLLFEVLAQRAGERHGRDAPSLDAFSQDLLMAYDWPGNVRELQNVAERYVLSRQNAAGRVASILRLANGEAESAAPRTLGERVQLFEKQLIVKALSEHKGDTAAVMEALQIPRRTLGDKMARHGLNREDFE